MNLQKAIATVSELRPVFYMSGINGNPPIKDEELKRLMKAYEVLGNEGTLEDFKPIDGIILDMVVGKLRTELESSRRMLEARKR